MKQIIFIILTLALALPSWGQELATKVEPPKAQALTELESLRIRDANQRRTILIHRLRAMEAEAKQINEELKKVAAEEIKAMQEAAKAHGVDFKTHQLDSEVKNFIPVKKETAKK